MMGEQVEFFVDGLIEYTKTNKLEWFPFSSCEHKQDILRELDLGYSGIDFGMNSVRESKSYYLKVKEGYVLLCNIYHGDPSVTSPHMDSLALMVKINDFLPIQDLTGYSAATPENLEILRVLAESQVENRYPLPDALYNFLQDVFLENK